MSLKPYSVLLTHEDWEGYPKGFWVHVKAHSPEQAGARGMVEAGLSHVGGADDEEPAAYAQEVRQARREFTVALVITGHHDDLSK